MMSIVEKAKSAESLFLVSISTVAIPLIDLRHFPRLTAILDISNIGIDYTNLPRLPLLQTFKVSYSKVPEIEHLHALFGSAPRLDSITFENLEDHDDSDRGLDDSGQQIFGLLPVSLPALTTLTLRYVPPVWSAHLLTIIRASKAVSLFAREVHPSVFQSHNFQQLATHALIGSDVVQVSVNAYNMSVAGGYFESEIAKDRTKMGGLDVRFIIPEPDEWQSVFQSLGAIIGSTLVFLQIGSLEGISIADLVETLKSAPNILPSVRTIEILDVHSYLIFLGLLSRVYVDELGQATWLAPGLEELLLPRSGAADHEGMVCALEQLWLERYAKLEINLNKCSGLKRIWCDSEDLVAQAEKGGLFPGTLVAI
ncbi:hypothetical protein FRC00_007534 [Tulasnella sp. 408]|nr:hypothetical protein FRC00_007534 [Tulasnella sp. 408]